MSSADRRLFAAVFLVAAVLTAPFCTSNENRTTVILRALEHGRLWIDPDVAMTGDRAAVPGRITAAAVALGGAVPATALRGGHDYSVVAPGLAFAVSPTYVVARKAGLAPWAIELALALTGATLPLALGAVAVARAVRATGETGDAALLAGATYGLGTIALAYGTRLWAHALAGSMLAWSLAMALEIHSRERVARRGALAGFFAAVAVATDYNVGLVAFALMGLVAWRGGARGALAFALGGLVPALMVASYHQTCFGSPFKVGYDFHAAAYGRAMAGKQQFGFVLPRPSVLLALLFGRHRGWLCTQPAALLGLVGLVALARSRVHAFALGVVAIVLLANAARAENWWAAGTCFGARYSTSALPFAMLGLPRGARLAGRLAPWILGTSGGLALLGASIVGSTTSFPFTVASVFEGLWFIGPRTLGLSAVVLGMGDHETTGGHAIVAGVALSGALPIAFFLLRPGSSWTALAALALAPWIALAPFLVTCKRGGPDSVRNAHTILFRQEVARILPQTWHPDEVRYVIQWANNRRDLVSVVLCYQRLLEFEPDNDDARRTLELAEKDLRHGH